MSAPLNILVVDDEPLVAKGLEVSLHQLGYRVVALADTGEEALEKIAAHRPNLVLMDIRIKGAMDGIQTAEKIRAQFDIPVIFLSAFVDDETLQRAKVTEPFGYIVKPFERQNLQSTIETARYKHQMERRLKESEQRYIATLRCLAEAVVATDTDGRITFLNPAAEKLSGWPAAEALGRPVEEVFQIFDEQTRLPLRGFAEATETWISRLSPREFLMDRSRTEVPLERSTALIKDDKGAVLGMVLVLIDISARKQANAEREKLIGELQAALASVKTLSGLLPICCHCNKIRDDQGYWNRLESYISSRSEAGFTHGVCPDCMKKYYPQIGAS
jgi:PAS domain S-box-containing protein